MNRAMAVAKTYYPTLKPERTYANVITTLASFLFAARMSVDWALLMATLGGTTLVVMSACAANNCTDRGIDAKMSRTRKRALVTHQASVQSVAALAVVLGVVGFALLVAYVNCLTVLLGAIAYVDYVVLYAWSNPTTPQSTLIGPVS